MKAILWLCRTCLFSLKAFTQRVERERHGLCVWLFALVIASLALCPPWMASMDRYTEHDRYGTGEDSYSNYSQNPAVERALQHAPLWERPPKPFSLWVVRVDHDRLILEALAAESLVTALYLTWGRKER